MAMGPSMSRVIWVLSASVGAGHLRAAEAVTLALHQLDPSVEVANHDVLQWASAAFRRVYGQAYLDLVNKAPHVLGYFYDRLDRPPGKGKHRGKMDDLRLILQKMSLRPFLRALKQNAADLIINTHFLSAEIVASLRRKGQITTPHFTVTTDFETHRLWVNQPCDRYFTATPEGAAYLCYWGVPGKDIAVTGIPIDPIFVQPKDRVALLQSRQLPHDRPVLLQLAGGFGVGPIAQIFHGLLEIEVPSTIIVVTGKNVKAKEQLERQPTPDRHRVQIIGYTREMDEWLAMADVVVSKPGGLTTSETLARGAVMVVINPIPGQESRNSDYLLENGAALKVNHVATLAMKINGLLQDQQRLREMKRRASALGTPDAALSIARQALAWVQNRSRTQSR